MLDCAYRDEPNAPEQPQRVAADFDQPDPEAERLFTSLGRAVTAAAAMEQALQTYAVAELAELHEPTDPRFFAEMTKLLKLTGGQVCARMRKLGLALPEHLAERIDDAIERRNALIHRSFSRPQARACCVREPQR